MPGISNVILSCHNFFVDDKCITYTVSNNRTTEGDSKAFIVKVGLHQGSILSPLLFVIVMEMISRELQAGLPLELLYADDLDLDGRE